MRTSFRKLTAALHGYFSAPRAQGLCDHFNEKRLGIEILLNYAEIWEFTTRCYDGSRAAGYFIPASKGDLSLGSAIQIYGQDMASMSHHLRQTRKEFANFVLKNEARKAKKKFAPIP
jgi:hypothetical protein